jgi:peptidoglycan/xylan/chitin deacetylase (PgdA/CDA1 family)
MMTWKNGKKWVYSITYDEGCVALLDHALAVHRKHGVPGHVAMVSTQVGVMRDLPASSYHGMMILSREQVAELRKEGWGVSCHSMTHASTTMENGQSEVVEARRVLEEKLGVPVTMFCVPGSNEGHPAVLKYAPIAGFNSIMTIYDRINTKATNLMWLARSALHTEYPGPFYSTFDPYKRIQQAIDVGGWIIDYAHCPMPDKPIHPAKDCTTPELDARFAAVRRLGGDDVWVAEPNEVVEYLLKDEESIRLRAAGVEDPYPKNSEIRAIYKK